MSPGLCMVPSDDILLFGHDEFHENSEQKLEGLLLISKFSWKWTKFKQSLNVSMHLKAGQRQKLCFLKELGLCISVKKFLKL